MSRNNVNSYEIKEKYTSILIAVHTANIEIKNSENGQTEVVCCENKNPVYSVNVEDQTLMIRRGKSKWYSFLFPSFKVPSITIYLPKAKLESIDVKSNTGKISLEDITCKSLKIISETARVNLEKTIVDEKLHIKTNTGRIQIKESDAGEIFIKSDTGNIYGSLLTDKAFVIRCNTGKINIPSTFGHNKCEIISNTGNVNFEIKNQL